MSSLTGGSYPPVLDDALERDRLVQTIKDWTIAHGLAVRPPPDLAGNDSEGVLAMSAPVTIFPSPFPKSCFDEAVAIQPKYNELYARISQDEKFLDGLVQEWVRCSPLWSSCSRRPLTVAGLLVEMSLLPTCGTSIDG
jgi:glutathione synthase